MAFNCSKCGKEAKNGTGLSAHERKCSQSPAVESPAPVAAEVVSEPPATPVAEPQGETIIATVKGWKIVQEGHAKFDMLNREGQRVGGFSDKTEAIRQLENMTRHVR